MNNAMRTTLVASVLCLSSQVQASTLSFFCITNTNAGDCTIGANQLSVEVSNPSSNHVNFKFLNNVGATSSITEIYFDAGQSSLSSPLAITDSDGIGTTVAFSPNANPGILPGGNSIIPPFTVSNTTVFTADSDAGQGGQMAHGVNAANEWLIMDYTLQSGKSFNDVLTELSNGKLRIGMHITGYASGGSESFVNSPGEPPNIIPVPAAVWLLGSGLLGLLGVARRKMA